MLNLSDKTSIIAKDLTAFKKIANRLLGILSILLFISSVPTQSITAQLKNNPYKYLVARDTKDYKVTFVELGSVRCIPCRQMQTVMKSIALKYGTRVKIIFHDVSTPEGKPYAEQFKIDAIPTQVFLDKTGKEYYRHEGFFPEDELVKVLQQKGVK